MKKIIFFHIIFLLKMLSADAQSDKKLIYEGNKSYEKQDYSAAEKNYRDAQEKAENKSVESNFNLGDALYQQGKYEEAAQQFNKAIQQSKDKETKAAAYHNLGNSMLKANKLDESIDAYKKSLRYNPGQPDAQYNLTYALKKKQKQEEEKKKQEQQNQQDENKPEPDKKNQPNENPNQPKPENGMNQEEAERILNALKNKEQNLRKRMYDKGDQPGQPYQEKPW